MYKLCVTEQSALRQRQLEQGLLKLLEKRPFEEISVSELCQELDVPRKAFYRYFSGKEGALHSLIDHALMDFDAFSIAEGDWANQHPREYMAQIFGYWRENDRLLRALSRSGLSGLLIQRAVDYTKQQDRLPMLLTGMDRELRNYGTMFAVCGIMAIIVQWHHDGYHPDVHLMADMALQLFQKPLYTARGEK